MSDKIFTEKTAKYLSFVGGGIIIISMIVFFFFSDWKFSFILNEEKVAQFGDFVGGVVGTIFAFVGVVLYYVALREQRKDIEINKGALETQMKALNQQIKEFQAQTEELQETRKVYEEQTTLYREQTEFYKKQVDELSKQTAISKLEQFDSSFYSFLTVFITFKESNKSEFSRIYDELIKKRYDSALDFTKTLEYFMVVYGNNSNLLSQYFKTIYRIFSIIDNSSLGKVEKMQYAKILRSQLTNEELLILFYNYQTELGQKARFFITQYELLKHLNPLDKIEYHITNDVTKIQLTPFVQRMFVIINSNIQKFNDIEDGGDINISENETLFKEAVLYKLEITESGFSYSIYFKQDKEHKNILDNIDIVKNTIKNALYDIFYVSKYKHSFQDNTFTEEESIITEGDLSTKKITFTANTEIIL
ncbi:MAG: hypothetical protein MJZ37_09955 [Bacilli bacterium]|nr:hypothetical protein [Bacilli bacterium]